MALSRHHGRSRFTLVLLVLTSLTLLTLDFKGFGPLDSARSAVLNAFAPVGDAASRVFSPIGDAWNSTFHHDELLAENERLREQVDELSGQLTADEVARESLRQLLEQADIPFVGDIPTAKARITSGAISNFSNTIEIDKGSAAGIERGMPVVTGRGLIGKVVRVSDSRSVVSLLTDGNFNVGFSIVGTDIIGVASGGAGYDTLRAVVDIDREVRPGQILVTSGIEGSYFPQGLPIGTVTSVEDPGGGTERAMDVTMFAALNDLSYVTVVLWKPVS